jgi:phage terminase large subunit-like protein
MMAPERCRRIIGSTCLHAMIVPRRLIAQTQSKASSLSSANTSPRARVRAREGTSSASLWTRYPEAWDMLMFGLRLGNDPRAVVTTTPEGGTKTSSCRSRLARPVFEIRRVPSAL